MGGGETEKAVLERPGEWPRLTGPALRGQRGPQVWRPRRGLGSLSPPFHTLSHPSHLPPALLLLLLPGKWSNSTPRAKKKKK